jgi:hypothetical protein
MHYLRLLRKGTVGKSETIKPKLKSSEPERLKEWMGKMYSLTGNGCWEWEGRRDRKGYGRLKIDGMETLAHRVSAFIYHSLELRSEIQCLHHCDNPPCINPDHLFLGTNKDNIDDKVRKGRVKSPRGMESPSAKLTDEMVREIRERRHIGETYTSLAMAYGIASQNICKCCKRITWKHIN